MGEVGILGEDDRVELLEGEIVEMVPIGPPHSGRVNRLNRLFVTALGDRVVVSVQNPVRLSDFSEPQPDLLLLRPERDFYISRHPRPDDVLLVVEVAASSALFDRRVKMPLYLAAGVPQIWLVDLDAQVVEVHRPDDGPVTLRESDPVPIDAFPDVVVTAAEILG